MDGATIWTLNFPPFANGYWDQLSKCVEAAKPAAVNIIAQGAVPVRMAHSQGCTNSSMRATQAGAIANAEEMLSRGPLMEEDDLDEPLFGAHLRRTIHVFRRAFGR